jgi:hypothetical protein
MNALPIENAQTPGDVIDELVASFGFRRVALAVIARIFRRTRPPDSVTFPALVRQPGVEHLSDHLRRDLGLEPDHGCKFHVDLIVLGHRGYM